MPSASSECGTSVGPTFGDLELAPRTLARFGQLAASNEPPLEFELPVIRCIVEQTSARLASLDAEIFQLKDRLRQLEEERTLLAKYHTQNITILSPLRRMPAEILGEIFSCIRPTRRVVLSPKNCPWVLTHVCSRWRALALSMPSLWSLICVSFSGKRKYPLEMIRTQLERARSLRIHFFGSEHEDSGPQMALFELLAEHSARWEELNIQLTSHLAPLMMPLSHDLVGLRRAWVQWDSAESQPAGFNSVDFLQMAISLVDIGVHSEYRFLPTRLPILHRLTRYDFDAPWQTHCRLLKILPGIQEVYIRCDFDDEDWPEPGESIDLAHLQRLGVTHAHILSYLRAPALQEINIDFTPADSTESCHHLEQFLVRSSSSPHRLCIRGALDAQSMGKLLQKYPCFTEINGTDEGDDDETTQRKLLSAFFTLFTISASTPSTIVLPHLTKIGYASHNPAAILWPLFLNMLDSRWNVGECALRAGELVFPNSREDPDPQSAARIATLREAGLEISLFSGTDAANRVHQWLHRTPWME